MRADEKIDPQLELEDQHDQVHDLEEHEEPDQALADHVDTSTIHFHELAAYIEALLAGEETALPELEWLSATERAGLALLEEAILGRKNGGQVYAEDRLEMLNQALAVLQPVIATGVIAQGVEAIELYATLVEDIAELQHSLESLSDAQEELFLREQLERAREGEKPGQPKPKPIDQGEVGDDRPSQLAGPGPAVEKPAAPSQLAGPGPAVEKPAVPTTLTGPGAAPEKKPEPSTAWDGDDRAGR